MKKTLIILEKILLVVLCGILLIAPFDKYLVKILYYLAISLWLTLNILKYKSKFYKGLFSCTFSGKAIVVFFLAAVISTIFSLKPYHSQEILFQRYFFYFILFYLGVDLIRNSAGPCVINFLGKKICLSNLSIIGGSFLLLGVVIGVGGVWDYYRFHPGRLWTVFGKEISFKMLPVYLVYLVPFSFTFFIYAKNKVFKVVGFIIFGLLVFVLICTSARAAWIAVSVSMLGLSLYKSKKLFLSVIIFVIGFLFLLPGLKQRAATSVDTMTWGGRTEMYKAALEIFKDYPVFGAGLGQYEDLIPIYKPKVSMHLHAHNTYLEVLAEMGVVGLLAFLWIFVLFFKNVFRIVRLCPNNNIQAIQIGLIGSIFSGLIFALSCTIIIVGFQSAVVFWILFGVSSGLASRCTKQPVLLEKVSI